MMNGESPKPISQAAETIFNAALAFGSAERTAYLAGACGNHVALRERVEALLAAHEQAGAFLPEQPGGSGAAAAGSAMLLELPLTEKPGDRIGRYKLREKIGEGGCGVVYVAEQEQPVRRKVALKVIKLGMDTKSVVARFEAERQALAMMDHPNIAKIYDAGVTGDPATTNGLVAQVSKPAVSPTSKSAGCHGSAASADLAIRDTADLEVRATLAPRPSPLPTYYGRPYFVMELVRGIKITDYCDQHQLPTRQRLGLFIQVCRAVQHAHQKGIIHRDLKPSNILVTTLDEVPVPKVIDFGIAKATEGRLTDLTVYTELHQFIGTPAYMSPEQAKLSPDASGDIDTRSDIYSLGVLLYELLTGKTPFDTKELLAAGLDEMRRTIRDKVPVRPSTRLTQLQTAQPVDTSGQSKTKNQKSKIEPDLDWIVMKCLEKDRVRRYETANGLARDIERHLNNEPVVARPPSKLYEFQMTVRRHRVGFAAAVAVLVSLLLGVIVSAWQAVLAKAAGHRADDAAAEARRNLYAADMSLAQRAIDEDDFARARAFLDHHRPAAGEPDLRGFEWRRLWQICQNDEAIALEPKVTEPRRVCVSADGRLIAASEAQAGPALIWDADSKRLLKTLAKGDRALAFAPAGPKLVTGGSGGLKVWNTLTWSNQYLGPSHIGAAAVFSGDGRWLVVQGRGLQVWDARTWTLVAANAVGEVNDLNVALLASSRDGSLVACGSGLPPNGTGQVHFFRLPKLEPLPLGQGLPATLFCLTFTPDGRQVVAGDCGGTIHVYEVATQKEFPSRMTAPAGIKMLAFSPTDPNLLATAGLDGTVRLWDFAAQKVKVALHYATKQYTELTFAPDGTWIAVGGVGNPILLFSTAGRRSNDLAAATSRVLRPLRFSADSRQLLTLNQDGEIGWWEVEAPALARIRRMTVPVADALVNEGDVIASPVAATPDLRWLALGGTNGQVRLVDLQVRTNYSLAAHASMVRGLGFSPDAQKLATVGEDQVLRVWDLAGHRPVASLPLPERLPDRIWLVFLSFSADGKYLVANSRRTLILWDAVHWRELKSARYEGDLSANHIAPDGQTLAAAAVFEDRRATEGFDLWDATSWAKRPVFASHGMVWDFDWSPDGRRLVTLADNESILWDTTSWQELSSFNFQAMIEFALFSPDGNKLALTDNTGALHVWRAPSLAQIEAQEAKRGRWP